MGQTSGTMKRITAYLRPHKLDPVATAISNLGISGISVTDVRGSGSSPREATARTGLITFAMRVRLEVIVQDELTEDIVKEIVKNAHTGAQDDGMIFIEPVADAIRVRTGERGIAAV